MNITQLARQLNVSPEELRTKLPELGFDIGMRAIKIDDAVAGKVKRSWAHMVKQKKREDALAEREAKNDQRVPADGMPKNIKIPSKIRVSTFAETLGMPVVKIKNSGAGYSRKSKIRNDRKNCLRNGFQEQ